MASCWTAWPQRNVVQGNYIGTDYTGKLAVGNSGNGIEVMGAATRWAALYRRHATSSPATATDGVMLDSTASGNLVQGNYLGINICRCCLGQRRQRNRNRRQQQHHRRHHLGSTQRHLRQHQRWRADRQQRQRQSSAGQLHRHQCPPAPALANSGNGIEIEGTQNTIGGTASGSLNVISGNKTDGVLLDSTASGNVGAGQLHRHQYLRQRPRQQRQRHRGRGHQQHRGRHDLGGTQRHLRQQQRWRDAGQRRQRQSGAGQLHRHQ